MSQIAQGILGALAVTLTLGAAQLASGGDLPENRTIHTTATAGHSATLGPLYDVNRTAKADRAGIAVRQQQGETVSVNMIDRSILMRIPPAALGEARRAPNLVPAAPQKAKRIVACEPLVSVLTELASVLQPGRCVT